MIARAVNCFEKDANSESPRRDGRLFLQLSQAVAFCEHHLSVLDRQHGGAGAIRVDQVADKLVDQLVQSGGGVRLVRASRLPTHAQRDKQQNHPDEIAISSSDRRDEP
jgi:hypothetical protein